MNQSSDTHHEALWLWKKNCNFNETKN